MIKTIVFFFFIIGALAAHATHNRSGEITYRQLGDLTFEFTITTYTREASSVDRTNLEIFWGDNTFNLVARFAKIDGFASDINKNVFKGTHTFPSPATYKISFEDANRNDAIINIPASVDVPFYVETVLVINPFQGYNNSPVLQQAPIDVGCIGFPFVYNPGAYDPDGTDSLAYRLVKCKGSKGQEIPGYTFPASSNSFSLNAVTGDLVWDSPEKEGEYNVAFIIEEWRNHQLVGSIERDMQIRVEICDTNPPIIYPLQDVCVIAGTSIQFDVKGKGPIRNSLSLTATGFPLSDTLNPAVFASPKTSQGVVQGTFQWTPTCADISLLPHWLIFKVTDIRFGVNYVDYKSVSIRVTGPAPTNLTSTANGNAMQLHWDKNSCLEALGYKVYRRIGHFAGSIQDPCKIGGPDTTNFTLIKTIAGNDITRLIDDDNGRGLNSDRMYCYIVTSFYKGGAESYASSQSCAQGKGFKTGMQEAKEKSPFVSVVPNPIIDCAIVEIDGFTSSENLFLIITDLVGKEILQIESIDNKIKINKGNLSPGLYLYFVKSNSTVYKQGKIILQ